MKTVLIAALLIIGLSAKAQIQDSAYFLPTQAAQAPELIAKQCEGIATTTGQRCRRKVFGSETHCKTHDPNAARCGQTTQKGTPCKIRVREKGDKCHHHDN